MDIKCPKSKRLIMTAQTKEDGTYSRFLTFFKDEKIIGAGGAGCVVMCTHMVDNKVYAVKKVLLHEDYGWDEARREVECLSSIYHENVVRYHDSWLESTCVGAYAEWDQGQIVEVYVPEYPCLYIQQELCSSSLGRVLKRNANLKVDDAWKIFNKILEGLNYIHSKGIVHGDLKPQNIFMDKNDSDIVKIGDFSTASIAGENLQYAYGWYVDHELRLKMRGPSKMEGDIFSLGMILIDMLSNFKNNDMRQEVLNSRNKEVYIDVLSVSEEMKSLIKRLVSVFPEERPDTSQIIKALKESTNASSSSSSIDNIQK